MRYATTIENPRVRPISTGRYTAFLLTAVMFPLAMGCDPCINNPCDDGLACNGTEGCSADGPGFVCSDGVPLECDPPSTCTEPDGACESPSCSEDADCDDGDACTTDTCSDFVCASVPVACASGQECDPATGNCVPVSSGGTPTTLIGSTGTYSGVMGCGDDDDQVMLVDNNGTLVLRGLAGNGDITLTSVDDVTATGSGVVVFGAPDHNVTVTLLANGQITLAFSRPGAACESTISSMP